ncbi:hypothetical protein Hanom_Chr17g01559811 [Helianthus anomalus]
MEYKVLTISCLNKSYDPFIFLSAKLSDGICIPLLSSYEEDKISPCPSISSSTAAV